MTNTKTLTAEEAIAAVQAAQADREQDPRAKLWGLAQAVIAGKPVDLGWVAAHTDAEDWATCVRVAKELAERAPIAALLEERLAAQREAVQAVAVARESQKAGVERLEQELRAAEAESVGLALGVTESRNAVVTINQVNDAVQSFISGGTW